MSKSPALRRIQADIRELSIDPSDRYHAHPLEHDMFEWHFTIRGPDGTDFQGGYYHGRILLPAEYPFKPPNIVFLTPSGRFETNTKVCLSFSAFHPELWQPAWGIRLILEALISFLPSKGDGAIGALDWTSEERKKLAKKSVEYCCPVCGRCSDILKRMEIKIAKRGGERDTGGGGSGEGGMKSNRFQKEIEQLHALQMASHGLDVSVEQKSEQVHETRDAGKGQEENSQDKEDEKEGIRQQGGVETNQNELISLLADDHQEQMDGKQGGELPPKTLMNQPDETNEPIELEKKTETTLEADDDDRDQNHGSIKPKEERLEQVETNNVQVERLETPILSDPVIHTGIVVFGIIVWLLVRKLSAIIEDLKALETEIQQFR